MFTQQYPLYFPTPLYATPDIISRLLWVLQVQPQCDLDDIFHCEDLVTLEELFDWLQLSDDYSVSNCVTPVGSARRETPGTQLVPCSFGAPLWDCVKP